MPSWFPHDLAHAVVFVPLRILFLVVLALLVRFVLQRLIDRTVRQATGGKHEPKVTLRAAKTLIEGTTGPESRRHARILALGSLGRSAVTLVVTLIAVAMIMSELGFNLTSLIAGTSIVAVTVAFGLQNVIKDFVSGIFMLIEDQLGVGDYVDMEKASGTVEEIGLRVTQLRDDQGNVWYVRNGEVVRVGNFSQGGSARPVEMDGPVTRVRLLDPVPALTPEPSSAHTPATTDQPAAPPADTNHRTHRRS